ncbi:MAG: DUF1697 domain-containing protein [Chloroflexota bacterium]
MPPTYLALLRGVNVGGKNKLPMNDLVQLFVEIGCGDVRSYIQSGNVVFTADSQLAETVPARVTAAIAERFGYEVPILLRTAEQIRDVLSNNPFLRTGAAEDTLHVLFLADSPAPHRIDALDPNRSRPDAFVVRGKEVYLWFPNGVAHTRLTNDYFDSKLATTSTGRNWRTVIKLFDLMKG